MDGRRRGVGRDRRSCGGRKGGRREGRKGERKSKEGDEG
jgi:hypothetical protein